MRIFCVYAGSKGNEVLVGEFTIPDDWNAFYVVKEEQPDNGQVVQSLMRFPMVIEKDKQLIVVPKHSKVDVTWLED